MSPRGLFVGLTTLDLVQRVARFPGPDEKVVALRTDLAAGGPAAAAAVTFAALGGQAVLLTATGPGPVGRWASADLDRCGVRVVDAWAGPGDLSVSAITVLDGTGQRSVVSRNAEDMTVTVPPPLPDLVAEADVVLADGHHPVLAVAAAREAAARGVPVVLDCGSAKPVYADLIGFTTAAVCSAGFRTGPDAPGGFAAVASALLAGGADLVAMSDGGHPLRWRTRGEAGVVPVPEVAVRDTLGAGDALHGAVAYALACGARGAPDGLGFGVAVASLRVQHVGPRDWLADERLWALGRDRRR